MVRLLASLSLLLMFACGLSDDPREEEKKHTYIVFSDANFEAYCLRELDLNADGRISEYEAERVRTIRCFGLNIRSLAQIGYFKNLEILDCSRNSLADLDLTACVRLREVTCGNNDLVSLRIVGLRSLASLICSYNALSQLDLTSNASLSELDAQSNRLRTLDVSNCAHTMTFVDVRRNPSMTTLYIARGQSVAYEIDGQTVVEER